MSESEFGEILDDVHDGDIIRAEDGTIVFLCVPSRAVILVEWVYV